MRRTKLTIRFPIIEADHDLMPHVVGLTDSFLAVTSGILVEERGCLFLDETGSPKRLLLIWPPGFEAVRTSDRLVVTDTTGAVFAEVGHPETLGGGRLSSKDVARFSEPDASGLCGASRYWVVSPVAADPGVE